jgi:hypothetical protein
VAGRRCAAPHTGNPALRRSKKNRAHTMPSHQAWLRRSTKRTAVRLDVAEHLRGDSASALRPSVTGRPSIELEHLNALRGLGVGRSCAPAPGRKNLTDALPALSSRFLVSRTTIGFLKKLCADPGCHIAADEPCRLRTREPHSAQRSGARIISGLRDQLGLSGRVHVATAGALRSMVLLD